MPIKLYQVDAFTDTLFSGNPAAVCSLQNWLPDELMQKIAMENNLAETAFIVATGNDYSIRWFTPAVEVDLCGHATLAAAHVLFNHLNYNGDLINFDSHSGALTVQKQGSMLSLNFPADVISPIMLTEKMTIGFNIKPVAAFKGKTDYMFVFADEAQIQKLKPDFREISKLPVRGIIVTAKSKEKEVDFVSRFFAPQSGIDEDPVTGSAHTTLIPYWAKQLGKNELNAVQLSARKGRLTCKFMNERVLISGHARTYLTGEIETGQQIKTGA